MIVAGIHTSRSGSGGVPSKNVFPVCGKPLFRYGIDACIDSRHIQQTIIASDIPDVISYANREKLVAFPLSEELAGGNHYETIRAAAEFAIRMQPVSVFAIVLGNAVGASGQTLDQAIESLMLNSDLDSVVSVSAFPMFNPLRAYVDRDGKLIPQVQPSALRISGPLNERRSIETPWFFNGSFWIVRSEVLLSNCGLAPFPWLGIRLGAFHQRTLMELDEPWQANLLPYMVDE